jgi:oxygen-independent coproporphyrinogen-3 oxidase
MSIDLVKRYAAPVPRYTSYPTANHFAPNVGAEMYRGWLAALPAGTDLSLYVHIPYCRELCWYCGCNMTATRRYEPVARYMTPLLSEITRVAALVPRGARVRHIHWGGGSPSILAPIDVRRLDAALRQHFDLSVLEEYAVEIDPRSIDAGKIAALAAVGINRVSLGVQDFAEKVQAAINRHQSYELTADVVCQFRAAGIAAINIDLVYGLPHQTCASVTRTIEQVLALEPDRIAIFGYAHLPARIRHQRLIDTATLPDALERYGQSRRLARVLEKADYRRIGLDHFARPQDTMGGGAVRRNFQGYTTDQATTLIGFGASAISRLPQGYAQNAVAIQTYVERMGHNDLATLRGWELTTDDRVRADAIEELMCDFTLSGDDLVQRYGAAAVEPVLEEVEALLAADTDGLVAGDRHLLRVSDRGRPFVRTICSVFDVYLARSQAQHALAV